MGGFEGDRGGAREVSHAMVVRWFGVVARWSGIAKNGHSTALAAIRHLRGEWAVVAGLPATASTRRRASGGWRDGVGRIVR